MPALAAEGLTAQRLALLAERVTRAESVLYDMLNEALMRLAPGPWLDQGPIAVNLAAFADLSEEIALRLLGRIIEWVGNEGPVELGKLEALCAALLTPRGSGRFRRTLAGAMITLSGGMLTIERAPSRRTGAKPRKSGPKPPFTKPR
jgi:tRNA(Ile)-lysidine synthase